MATVCIAVVAALGVTLYHASEDMEQALVEELVTEEMESLIERTRLMGGRVPTAGPNLQYYVLASPDDQKELPPRIRNLGPGHHQVGVGGDELHVVVRDIGGTRYMVAYDEGPHEAREARFRQLVWLMLGTAAIIAVVVGYWVAGVLTRQLTELASRVEGMAPDAPHAALERPDHDREVAAVAHALDAYQERIVSMMRREQEFTANASHELRTPLTAIRTSCELLSADGGLSDKARSRIEMIDSAARQMTDRIETLLLLARQNRGGRQETVALRDCIDDAAGPYREEMSRKGLAFDVRIPDESRLQIDRKALQLVLANLLRNAVRHTDEGYIRVSYDAPRLTVSDSGAGIASQHLPQLFERYYRAEDQADGLGLGLAIVRRICDNLGWKIEVQSRAGAGSSFSVVFA